MFSKLKNFPSRWGNKSQRKAYNEVAKSEMSMAVKLIQLELREEKVIKAYIQEMTDDQKFPMHITKRALYTTAEMTKLDKQQKIVFLEKQGIATNYDNDGRVSFMEKVN